MSKRDALKGFARTFMGLVKPKREEPARPASVYQPPPREAAGKDSRIVVGDLFLVRGSIEPEGRPRVVNHWATWCDPCLEELPMLVALHRRIGDKADFVGVGWELFSSAGGPEQAKLAMEAVCDEHGIPWKTYVFDGQPEDLFQGLQLPSDKIPQTFLLDADGAVRFHHEGALGGAQIEQIEAIVKTL